MVARVSAILLLWTVSVGTNNVATSFLQVKGVTPRRKRAPPPKSEPSSPSPLPLRNSSPSRKNPLTRLKSVVGTSSITAANNNNTSTRRWRPLVTLAFLLLLATQKANALATLLKHLVLQYKHALTTTHPILTKVLTGGILAVMGDALAQSQKTDQAYQTRQALSFGVFDACYRLFQHAAFPLITTLCQGQVLGSILGARPLLWAACERALAYQLLVVPTLYYPTFFLCTGLLQGLSLRQTWQRAEVHFVSCWKRNLVVWLPIQFFMFACVAPQWQVPFVCAMGICGVPF